LDNAGDCIDIAGVDHYPGDMVNQNYDHWGELDTLFAITDEYGKKSICVGDRIYNWILVVISRWILYAGEIKTVHQYFEI